MDQSSFGLTGFNFFFSNRVFTEGTCKLLNLIISDLVDEDFVLHNRKQAISALIFGTSALFSKPGQTLAPLIGTWLLAKRTGQSLFYSDDLWASSSTGRTSFHESAYLFTFPSRARAYRFSRGQGLNFTVADCSGSSKCAKGGGFSFQRFEIF